MRRSKRLAVAVLATLAVAPQAMAAESLAALSFLVGKRVADTDPAARPNQGGTSEITPDLNGTLLVRRDRTHMVEGGDLDMVMTMYAEGGHLRADFFDTVGHVIHYRVTDLEPGHRVQFTSDPAPANPTFRLTYEGLAGGRLAVRFEIAPPGSPPSFKLFTEGTLSPAP
ncbi:hypothetical protein [Nitrospirillum sp. BR 11163]|uniref:hypothetical protein n=1 Tax=Nitrospirillum sp. BR 11163 TaxID=3104323 RepID=UPI002AFFBB04|nr:hypothetical protein [Nitrospirillum sp. BR 11163]MEA1676114.1 hypothetical protein [Nitrospirillum sp. BR 11163]